MDQINCLNKSKKNISNNYLNAGLILSKNSKNSYKKSDRHVQKWMQKLRIFLYQTKFYFTIWHNSILSFYHLHTNSIFFSQIIILLLLLFFLFISKRKIIFQYHFYFFITSFFVNFLNFFFFILILFLLFNYFIKVIWRKIS